MKLPSMLREEAWLWMAERWLRLLTLAELRAPKANHGV
jgi:hypothetical protein